MAPLLRMAAGALQQLGAQLMPLHKATAKLSYVTSSLFVGLLEEGFCTAEESTEEAAGGEGGTFKEAEGTVSPHHTHHSVCGTVCYTVLIKWLSAEAGFPVRLLSHHVRGSCIGWEVWLKKGVW